MKDKVKEIGKIAVVIVLIIGIIIALINIISSIFTEKDLLTAEELSLYMTSGNLLKNHNTYYFAKDCIENLLEGCEKGLYNDIYELYLKDYKLQGKQETIELIKERLVGNQYEIINIYSLDTIDNEPLLVCLEVDGREVNILLELNQKQGASYSFALIG